MSEEADKIEFVRGQVRALIAFATAVIQSCQEPERLDAVFAVLSQVALASSETTLVSDRLISGMTSTNERLRESLATRLRNQGMPRNPV